MQNNIKLFLTLRQMACAHEKIKYLKGANLFNYNVFTFLILLFTVVVARGF